MIIKNLVQLSVGIEDGGAMHISFNSWSHSRRYNVEFIPVNEFEKEHESLKELLNQPKNSNLGNACHMGPYSELPRDKAKTYFGTNNIRRVSKLIQADSTLLNKSHIEKLKKEFDHISKCSLMVVCYIDRDRQLFDYLMDHMYRQYSNKQYVTDDIKILRDHYKKGFPIALTMVKNINISKFPFEFQAFLQPKKLEKVYYPDYNLNESDLKLRKHLHSAFKCSLLDIIYDEDIYPLLTEEAIELTDQYLKTLSSMVNSKNQTDINLALEILSKVDIEKNLLTIALFLNSHLEIFEWGSGLSYRKVKSFTPVLLYLKNKKIFFEKDWRIFCSGLFKKYQNDPETLKIVNAYIKENINVYLGGSRMSSMPEMIPLVLSDINLVPNS